MGEFRPKNAESLEERKTIELSEFLLPPNPKYAELIEILNEKKKLHPAGSIGYTGVVHTFKWNRLIPGYQPRGRERNERSESYELSFDDKSAETLEREQEQERRLFEFFRSRLKDSILVDLGGGYGHMDEFARACGASTYINVNHCLPNHREDPDDPTIDLSKGSAIEGMQVISVKADNLDFISRLPSASVNVVMNGVDEAPNFRRYRFLEPDNKEDVEAKETKYLQSLSEEIVRALKKGGIIFGWNTLVLDEDYEKQYLKNEKYHLRPSELMDQRWPLIFIKEE